MRWPVRRFRLWMAMAGVAIFAGVTAELVQRRGRLVRLCIAHHERADAYLDQIGRVCKFGETTASIDAFYRRQGPSAWLSYQAAVYHLTLAGEYERAANRTWLPLLDGLPPIGGLRDVRSIAEWGREAAMEAFPLFGVVALLLSLRAGITKTVGRSLERDGATMIDPERQPRADKRTWNGR
jgi:hypothetical protein